MGKVDVIEASASQRNALHSEGTQLIQHRRVQMVVYKNADCLALTGERCSLQVQRFRVEDPFDPGISSVLFQVSSFIRSRAKDSAFHLLAALSRKVGFVDSMRVLVIWRLDREIWIIHN